MSEWPELESLVEAFGGARVLCVGDVILDHFRHGTVERISPEAPVPVLKLGVEENAQLGGAGNVVGNLVSLGVRAQFVTVIGAAGAGDADHAGKEILRLLDKHEIGIGEILLDRGRRTSTKTRYFASGQQILRTDHETPLPLANKIRRQLIDKANAAMADCAVVVLSDYGKGVLDDGVALELIEAARKQGKYVIVDPKDTDYRRYGGANLLTPNRKELADASRLPVDTEKRVAAAARKLIGDHGLGAVLATLGRDGMTLVTAEGEVSHLTAQAREVFDVSGAGDTVAATLAAALGTGSALKDAAELANVAAGIVVGKVGTAAASAADVINALHHRDISSAEAKVMALQQALETIDRWRRREFKVGFTNGCFDLLHPGHVSLLAQAKTACDRLVVGLNSDASVRRLGKGDGRPVQAEAARATVLASLATVDLVVIFTDDTPAEMIEAIRPDVLVKGADYELPRVVGADLVRGYGGKVLLADLEPDHSTTATIKRMAK